MTLSTGVKNDLAQMFVWLTVNDPTTVKNILTGNYSIPSLDGDGKMSKSKPDKTVINLTDDLATIQKKIAKIPSTEKNHHVFLKLFWSVISVDDKDDIANEASRLLKVFLKGT